MMMWSSRSITSCCLSIWTLLLVVRIVWSGRSASRHISILNNSGRRVEIYWINPDTGENVLMSDPHVVSGADFPLDSYVGHTFEARELPNKKTGECQSSSDSPGECHRAVFSVSENDNQIANITSNFELLFVDNKIKARAEAGDLVNACQEAAKQRLTSAVAAGSESTQLIMDDLIECVHSGVADALEKVNEEIGFQAEVRKQIAASLENYTCVDDTLNSTKDIREEIWHDDGDRYTVHIKHDRKASKIHFIEEFIRQDECDMMLDLAKPTLHRAAVADGKGGSQVSNNRKAMQAGVPVPWDEEENDHPVARLSRRVYDYTNHVLGLNIDEFGQEELMSIQYFGRGRNDTEPDQYTPHCDGDCTGLQHVFGQRMATMVMYCDIPEVGGHTNFRNAGVHVKPEKHGAVFFSYMDPETRVMDSGFTEHSGCPVYEGYKHIVTQWIRFGVDTENPWDSFNTLGIKLSDIDPDDL
jgi:hypothetical protein